MAGKRRTMKSYLAGLHKEIAVAAGSTKVSHEQLFKDIDRDYDRHRSALKEQVNESAKRASEALGPCPHNYPRRPFIPLQEWEQ